MTPKLRLRDAERKVLLSWMLQSFLPGKSLTRTSMKMILAPNMQAIHHQHRRQSTPMKTRHSPMPLTHVMIHPRVSLSNAILDLAAVAELILRFASLWIVQDSPNRSPKRMILDMEINAAQYVVVERELWRFTKKAEKRSVIVPPSCSSPSPFSSPLSGLYSLMTLAED